MAMFAAAIGLASMGCETTQTADVNPPQPWVPPGLESSVTASTPSAPTAGNTNVVRNTPPPAAPPPLAIVPTLQAGEKVQVIFADVPARYAPPPHEQRIRGDGTVTLPYGISVMAAGKTPGQLEDDIREAYLKQQIYKRLTVTVKADDRTFFVGGEVKFPNRQPYTDRITVLRAIQAAGDFTDFANRKRIELRRSTGEKFTINWYDAKENPRLDLEVFPGDTIYVYTSLL